ncbi:hypothetical protein ACFV1L_29710 [Kitasatospora sp. NPDC059646]|uniref:hypothetical protein n=1 Tax=Kitasatospora sp. NPDC059646 TaxID=3346893 RepID=UPI0036A7509B
MKKIAAILAGTAVLTLGSVMPAHASDDWTKISGWTGLANKQPTGYMNYNGQVEGWGRVDWSGTTVEVHTGANDLWDGDGFCAVTQLRYHVKTGSSWNPDWQYRTPAIDCSSNGSQVTSPYYSSNYPIKDVTFRTCLGFSDGRIWECGNWSW